jgi:nicotinamidase-related amidase
VAVADVGFRGIADISGGLPDFPVTADSTALMIVDMQFAGASRDYRFARDASADGWAPAMEYYFSRLETVAIPNVRRLLDSCRQAGLPVLHVRLMNLAHDCSDANWRYKLLGLLVAPGSKDSEFVDELAPLDGEIVLSKSTSNVFASTNADHILRNLGVDRLIMTGIVTNNCVESCTRGAADMGYRVLLVDDACAAWTPEGHDHTMRHLDRNFASVKTTDEVLDGIAAATVSLQAHGVPPGTRT